MITFCAPASRCLAASSRLVKNPVDSITTSMPRSPQGSAPGSRSASTLTSRPSTVSASSPPTDTSPGKLPKTESYLSRWPSVPASVMSLTATISTSASDSWAARNTLRPMRPKPLMPTRTAMGGPFPEVERRRRVRLPKTARRLPAAKPARSLNAPSLAVREPVDVAVGDLDEVLLAVAEDLREVLGDRQRAVATAGAADRHHQVRLALGHELREQELQQRDHVAVELLQPAVSAHVLDDRRVEAGQRAQVGLVVRVGQEADVEREVGVARRPVLVPERGERDRQPPRRGGREQLVGDLAAERGGRQARRVDHDVGALLDRGQQLLLGADAVDHAAVRGERMPPPRLLVALAEVLLVGGEEDHAVHHARRGQLVDHARERGQILAAARVAHDRRELDLGALVHEQLRERADHLRRQVVDAEVAGILEHVHRRRLAGARQAGDDDEILQARAGPPGFQLLVADRVGHAYRPVLLRWAYRSRATFCGNPGTFSSSSRLAASTASGEPKCLSSARLRAGPMPGSSSKIDSVIALSRRIR